MRGTDSLMTNYVFAIPAYNNNRFQSPRFIGGVEGLARAVVEPCEILIMRQNIFVKTTAVGDRWSAMHDQISTIEGLS